MYENRFHHVGVAVPKTNNNDIQLCGGDIVYNVEFGEGVVVGFSSLTGEPMVFFYSEQSAFYIAHESLRKTSGIVIRNAKKFTISKEAHGAFADGEEIRFITYLRVEYSAMDRIFGITIVRDNEGRKEMLKIHAESVDIQFPS